MHRPGPSPLSPRAHLHAAAGDRRRQPAVPRVRRAAPQLLPLARRAARGAGGVARAELPAAQGALFNC